MANQNQSSGQQNQSQSGTGQQQAQGGQQQQFSGQGAGGQQGGFADQLQPHQEVVDSNGQHVGTIDHVDGDRIKLTRKDSDDGQHHYVQVSQVSGVEGNKVRLRERGDNDFGQEA